MMVIGNNQFEILCFDGTNFAFWKLKMNTILIKDGYVVAIEKYGKTKDMTTKRD